MLESHPKNSKKEASLAAKLSKTEFVGSGPVRYRIVELPDDKSVVAIQIDYTDAPVPKHYYLADYFRILS